MYCRDCGKTIPDDSVFCPECGAKLAAAPAGDSRAFGGVGSNTAAPAVPVSSGLNIGIIIASLFMPIVGLVMGFIYFRDPNPAKKKAGRTWLWVGAGAGLFWILASLGNAGGGW
jgi:uncharacterized membrane protein YvbJ